MSTNKRYDQEEEEEEEEEEADNPDADAGREWRRGPLLGKGRCGTVHVAAPVEPRAPRFRHFPPFMAVKSSHGPSRADLENEKSLLRKLSGCPHVIRYLGDEETTDEDGTVSLHVFLEFASGGTLARLIEDSPVDLQLLRRHTRSVLEGLRRIHDEGFVHCDLKPENILLVRNDPDDEDDDVGEFGFTAKVADLGLAKRARREKDNRLRLKGTMIYLPPEAAKFYVQEQASDVWALGCIVLKMFGGKLPWESGKLEKNEIKRKIAMERPVLPVWLPEEARDFLAKCFVSNPGDRATTKELLSHPFVLESETNERVVDNDRSFSFTVVASDCSRRFKPTVVCENATLSEEKKEENSCDSNESTIRAFGTKSLSQLQKCFP